MINFRNVTKRFPDGTVAVDNLSLRVEEGSFTIFVGPSGCGKTTSMRMINRMIDATSGVVSVQGRDVRTVAPVQLRLGIGYVIQNAGLMPHRTVVDNIATVPILRGESRRHARLKALRMMARVGLDLNLAVRFPAQLSGGQQQRVGVARALAGDPPILLMDEPFSAVDPLVREDLQQEIRRLQAELAKTIVFVTHDIDEAVTLGDQIAVFGRGGALQQFADPQTILNRPANPFVESLVGRDRGYRSLSFHRANSLPMHKAHTATDSASLTDLKSKKDEWVLLVDKQQHPTAWAYNGVRYQLGSTATVGGNLRRALDSCLSSPANLGVMVDSAGALLSLIHASDVLTLVKNKHELL